MRHIVRIHIHVRLFSEIFHVSSELTERERSVVLTVDPHSKISVTPLSAHSRVSTARPIDHRTVCQRPNAIPKGMNGEPASWLQQVAMRSIP